MAYYSQIGVMEMIGDRAEEIPLIVGLTTLPSRIDLLRPTLDSLGQQTKRPDRILLCLPRWSRREACEYQRPGWLADYEPMLQVVECAEDWGPGTKLLGCLDHLVQPSCLVIADDDMKYRSFFLEGLYTSQLEDKGSSFSYWTFSCDPITVGQGADGYSFYSPNLDGIKEFSARALQLPHLRIVDDLWISAFLKRAGVEVKSLRARIPDGKNVYEVSHSENQLSNLDGAQEREEVMTSGKRSLLESGLLGRSLQAEALLKRSLRAVKGMILNGRRRSV